MKQNKAFRNFKVQRTIEIQMTTQDEKLTQEDAAALTAKGLDVWARETGNPEPLCLFGTDARSAEK